MTSMSPTSRHEREQTLDALREDQQFIESVIDASADVLYIIDENGELVFGNEKLAERFEDGNEEVDASHPNKLHSVDRYDTVRDAPERMLNRHTEVGLHTKASKRIPNEFREMTITDEASGEHYHVGIVAVTERKQRERELERQRDELETLNRINGLLLELTRALFGTPTREAIERTVCEHLADSSLYEFAWIGELNPGTNDDQLVPQASAGVDGSYAEAVAITADGTETETGYGSAGRAFRTEEIQISQDVGTDPACEPWREVILDRGVRSSAAIPLLHGGTTYGILSVYSARSLAFSRRERDAFEVLGEAVGFVINAIQTRRLLFADAVLELEFQLADSDLFLVRHSEQFDCELSVEGSVATKSGSWLLYVDVQGASPATLSEAAETVEDLEHVRVVREEPEDGVLEYRFSGPCLLEKLADAGAKLRSAEAADGSGRLVVEAPQSADVRELVGRVGTAYPGATLSAQRERDRSVAEAAVPGGPFERLTDRQHEVLETAYHAGYFDWPRESTAEEVAASMDIAAPTLHRHFRRAEKRLLSGLFDPAARTPERSR